MTRIKPVAVQAYSNGMHAARLNDSRGDHGLPRLVG